MKDAQEWTDGTVYKIFEIQRFWKLKDGQPFVSRVRRHEIIAGDQLAVVPRIRAEFETIRLAPAGAAEIGKAEFDRMVLDADRAHQNAINNL